MDQSTMFDILYAKQSKKKSLIQTVKLFINMMECPTMTKRERQNKLNYQFQSKQTKEINETSEKKAFYQLMIDIRCIIMNILYPQINDNDINNNDDDTLYYMMALYSLFHKEQYENNEQGILEFDYYINSNQNIIASVSPNSEKYIILKKSLLKSLIKGGDNLNDQQIQYIFNENNINYIKWNKDDKELIQCIKNCVLIQSSTNSVIYIMKHLHGIFEKDDLLKINGEFIEDPDILILINWSNPIFCGDMIFVDKNKNKNKNENENENENKNDNMIDNILQNEGGLLAQYESILSELYRLFNIGQRKDIELFLLSILVYNDEIMADDKYASSIYLMNAIYCMMVKGELNKSRRQFIKSIEKNPSNLYALYYYSIHQGNYCKNMENATILFQQLYISYPDPSNVIGINSEYEKSIYKIDQIKQKYEKMEFKQQIDKLIKKKDGLLIRFWNSIKTTMTTK